MIDLKNINNNILSKRWKERYAKLPDEIKDKLEKLDNAAVSDYQLQVIKRKRIYPEIGDVFQINPNNDIFLYGIVVNNHITNINGEELILILIFKKNVNLEEILKLGIRDEDLLIKPAMVGKEYWTRGYFYNISWNENIKKLSDYGFYSIGKGKFFDEYGNELKKEPKLLGVYGVSTIHGIAMEINQELIIEGIL